VKTCECRALNQDDAVFCDTCGRRFPAMDVAEVTPSTRTAGAVPVKTIPRERILKLAGGFIAVILVLALGLTIGLRHVHIDISTNNVVSVQLPLNVCTTSVGDASETPAILPSTLSVTLPKQYSTQFAVYSDNEGLTELLAPTGWSCTAGIGADGSSSVQVSPPGQNRITSATLSAGSTAEEIHAAQTSACVGCREALACPLFATAANDYRGTFEKACPTKLPSSEAVTKRTSHLVDFTDPPGVRGDADPSGGANPAMGVMTYFDETNRDGSWTETCVLPASETSVCQVILANFATRYGTR
jgi:hypothetical protein